MQQLDLVILLITEIKSLQNGNQGLILILKHKTVLAKPKFTKFYENAD